MAQPDESLVRTILQRHDRGIRLRRSVAAAWDAFREKYPDRAWWRRKSTRAAIMWEYSVDYAIAAYQDDRGVQAIPHHDTMSFVMDDTVLIRIKKTDMELKSSNIQTLLASLFHEHDTDLFGYAGLQRVDAAYVLNRFETAISWIGIVAREDRKKRNLFDFEFNELAVAKAIVPFPTRAKPSPADLAKIKKPSEQAREDQGDE